MYIHVTVGVFTRTPFILLSRLADSTFLRMDGAFVDAWLYFPRLKGRENLSLFFLLDHLVALVINRCLVGYAAYDYSSELGD